MGQLLVCELPNLALLGVTGARGFSEAHVEEGSGPVYQEYFFQTGVSFSSGTAALNFLFFCC